MRHAWLVDELRDASLPLLRAAAAQGIQQAHGASGIVRSGEDRRQLGPQTAGMDLRQQAQMAYSFGKV